MANIGLGKSKRSVDRVFIDIDENQTRLILAKETPEHVSIADVRWKQFGPDADDEIVKFVNESFRHWKLKDRQAFMVIPSKFIITKNVDIPSKDKEEIRKIIDLQAGRYTPYSRDEILIDSLSMETSEQPYTNVLLVIIQRKIIQRYYDILNRALVEGQNVIVVSEALSKTYEKVQNSRSGAAAGICILGDSTDLTITDNQQMIFVRSIPIGLQHFNTDQETAKKDFIAELQKSVIAYQDQGIGRPVQNFLLSGLISGLDFIEASIREGIPGIVNGQIALQKIDPRSIFSLHDQAIREIEASKSVSWFDLFACAHTFSQLKIDLVPKEVKMKHQFRKGSKDVITLGTLLMAIFVMFSVFLVSKIFIKKEQIRKLEGIDKVASEESKILEQTSTKTRILKDLIRNRGRGLYVFEKINSMIGNDIYLSSLSYDKDGKVTFMGTADSMSRVFAFVTELEESNYFRDVKTLQTKSRREGQKEVADFEIASVVADGTATLSETPGAPGSEKKPTPEKEAAKEAPPKETPAKKK